MKKEGSGDICFSFDDNNALIVAFKGMRVTLPRGVEKKARLNTDGTLAEDSFTKGYVLPSGKKYIASTIKRLAKKNPAEFMRLATLQELGLKKMTPVILKPRCLG